MQSNHSLFKPLNNDEKSSATPTALELLTKKSDEYLLAIKTRIVTFQKSVELFKTDYHALTRYKEEKVSDENTLYGTNKTLQRQKRNNAAATRQDQIY